MLDAEPGTVLTLGGGERRRDRRRARLAALPRRAAGSYTIHSESETTAAFDVHALDELPPPSFYAEQRLPAGGFGYLQTRDGTTLSVNVVLPGPAEAGPYPTVVEYSGYEPSNPAAASFAQIYTTLGYAYVGVNVRGSGCSGGSFRFFEDAQLLDGYDAIETVAAQPWVLGNRVGMVGVSYPGISQLFVASTNPPSLAAITPLSVIDDSALGVIYPGGILNTGFGVEWTAQRMEETRPEGQAWTADRIAGGDTVCAANQRLRLQNPDLVQEIEDNPFWSDDVAAPIAPRLFVDDIDVPVFLAGAWQDEQTGGRFATMLDRFTGTDHFYASLVNGLHTDSIGPGVAPRYVEFLELYVARRVPSLAAARQVAPVLSSVLYGTDQVTLPADRFAGQTYEQALATFEAEPPIQVLFESGAGDGAVPGSPQPRWIESFDEWPVPAEPGEWYLGPDGALTSEVPADDAVTSYRADPAAVPPTFLPEGANVWAYNVQWDWRQPPEGTAASFVSEPMSDDTTFVGSGSADLWIRSDADDTDLEVTISEIRPGRSGDVRAERVAAGEPPGPRRGGVDGAATRTHASRGGCRTARRRRVEPGARRAVPLRPRLPCRLAAARHGGRARRQPRRVGVRDDLRRRDRRDRPRHRAPFAHRAAGRRRHRRARRVPDLHAARPAVPAVRASPLTGVSDAAGRRRAGRRRRQRPRAQRAPLVPPRRGRQGRCVGDRWPTTTTRSRR